MSFWVVLKLVFFLIWPFLLLLLYYCFDKEGFKRRMDNLKQRQRK